MPSGHVSTGTLVQLSKLDIHDHLCIDAQHRVKNHDHHVNRTDMWTFCPSMDNHVLDGSAFTEP